MGRILANWKRDLSAHMFSTCGLPPAKGSISMCLLSNLGHKWWELNSIRLPQEESWLEITG